MYSIQHFETPGSKYDIYLFLLVNSIFFILFLLVTGLHLGFTFIQQWRDSLLLAGKLKDENNQAKIIGYRQQLNPHFVFNNLNILTALIEKDPVAAKLFVEQFSLSYRYLLQGTDKEMISLETELQFIESYIYLLKVRFQEGIQFSVHLTEPSKKLFLPPFSIQLLIENCVKHNITSSETPLVIELFSSDKAITVKNKLQLKTMPDSGTATGLKNIINRYTILTDLPVQIEKTNSYYSVTLPLLEPDEHHYY